MLHNINLKYILSLPVFQKDFHNEIGVPQDVPSANPAGGPLFTMVPPIEDTPNDTLVTFEPLPSLPQHMNSGQDEVKRKPKIFNVSRDKARSNSLLSKYFFGAFLFFQVAIGTGCCNTFSFSISVKKYNQIILIYLYFRIYWSLYFH